MAWAMSRWSKGSLCRTEDGQHKRRDCSVAAVRAPEVPLIAFVRNWAEGNAAGYLRCFIATSIKGNHAQVPPFSGRYELCIFAGTRSGAVVSQMTTWVSNRSCGLTNCRPRNRRLPRQTWRTASNPAPVRPAPSVGQNEAWASTGPEAGRPVSLASDKDIFSRFHKLDQPGAVRLGVVDVGRRTPSVAILAIGFSYGYAAPLRESQAAEAGGQHVPNSADSRELIVDGSEGRERA
jgi:hypothetical protein